MYYQNYEDYMRSVLGYPIEPQNTYEQYNNYPEMHYEMSQMPVGPARYSSEIMNLYPEIYKVVNPMVCKICEANTKPITRELIDSMTDEIYMNLESQPDMNTVVNVRGNASASSEKQENLNRTSSSSSSLLSSSSSNRTSKTNLESTSKSGNSEKRESVENRENRQDSRRRPNDNTLQDLIRILILNQLLGGNFPNNRPPRPSRPPRPPMRPSFPRNDMMYENYFI